MKYVLPPLICYKIKYLFQLCAQSPSFFYMAGTVPPVQLARFSPDHFLVRSVIHSYLGWTDYRIHTNFLGMQFLRFSWSTGHLWNFDPQNFIGKTLTCINWRAGYLVILENKIENMLNLWHPWNLHASNICMYMVQEILL